MINHTLFGCLTIFCSSKKNLSKTRFLISASFGGYDEERFVNKVDARLLCPTCFKVVKDPVQCPNENHFCRSCFRRIVCDECGEQVIWKSRAVHICFMRKEIDDLVKERKEFKEKELAQGEINRKLMADVAGQMLSLTSEVKYPSNETRENGDFFTGRRKIFVCGGRDDKYPLNTVESFSWPENTWTLKPAMNMRRKVPSSFLYEGQIYVSGGWTGHENTDTIEMQRMDQEWIGALVKMPIKCQGHGMVCNEDKAILTGGRTVFPYTKEQVLSSP